VFFVTKPSKERNTENTDAAKDLRAKRMVVLSKTITTVRRAPISIEGNIETKAERSKRNKPAKDGNSRETFQADGSGTRKVLA
jgi:hypothetical protein